jgi:secreted trypsin-like serine protease
MTRPLGFVLSLVVAGGACVDGAPSLGSHESPIRGGVTDQGDPAVVGLGILSVYSYCSGTLIAPHTVLTAGHCEDVGTEVEFGTDADDATKSITIAKTIHHPLYTGAGKPYDFALLRLDSPATGVVPARFNITPLTAADVGKTIRHVGFGVTDDSTDAGGGTKRTVSYTLNQVQPTLVYSGAAGKQSCDGDSGGPGFMVLAGQSDELLVSVISDGPECQLSQDGWDGRVDVVNDWIVQTLQEWDPGSTTGTEPGTGSGSGSDGTPPTEPGAAMMQAGCSAAGSTGADPSWLILAGVLVAARARMTRRWSHAGRPYR